MTKGIIFQCSQNLGEEINGKGYECPGSGWAVGWEFKELYHPLQLRGRLLLLLTKNQVMNLKYKNITLFQVNFLFEVFSLLK